MRRKNGKDKRNIAKVKYENVLVKRKLKRAQNKIVNLKESKEALTKQKDSCIKEIKKKSVILSKGLLLLSEVLEP